MPLGPSGAIEVIELLMEVGRPLPRALPFVFQSYNRPSFPGKVFFLMSLMSVSLMSVKIVNECDSKNLVTCNLVFG